MKERENGEKGAGGGGGGGGVGDYARETSISQQCSVTRDQ